MHKAVSKFFLSIWKRYLKQYLPLFLLVALLFGYGFSGLQPAYAASIDSEIEDLNSQIEAQQKQLEDLQKQKAQYQKDLAAKQKEVVSLKNQLSILDDNLAETKVDIEANRIATTKTILEIQNTTAMITQTENEIAQQKKQLAEILRLLYTSDQRSIVEILLLNDSLSQYFDQVKNTEDLQKSLQGTLEQIQTVKTKLDQQKQDLTMKKSDLDKLRNDLEIEQAKLASQKTAKDVLLVQTKGSEQKYQTLLTQIQQQWQAAQADIAKLESAYRAKMAQKQSAGQKLWSGGTMSWPVPSHIVTCEFHDPEYPFRKSIGEHSAVDLRAPQGTPIAAPASGYVAQAKNNGMGYSYIILIHNDSISTVYGHVSKIYVKVDQFVTAGQIIGATGGTPGTPGAGSFTTAPHLHFEVRSNGLPVNPLDYLR